MTIDEDLLDANMLGAYNLSVENRKQQLLSEWMRLREDYRSTRPPRAYNQRSRITRICEGSGTVKSSQLPPPESARCFPWPEAEPHEHSHASQWVVICNFPECRSPYFVKHPLRKQRAVDHFASHGLHLRDDSEVIDLFGYKGKSQP